MSEPRVTTTKFADDPDCRMILAENGGPPEIIAGFTSAKLASTYVKVWDFLYEMADCDKGKLEEMAAQAYMLCDEMAGG